MPVAFSTPVPVAPPAPALAPPTRWLGVVSHLHPRYGGLSAVVPQLAARLAQADDRPRRIALAAFCLPGEQYRPPAYPHLAIDYWPTGRKAWLLDGALRRRFRASLGAADAVHIHGLWDQSTLAAARAARALGKPYILSAHGMLEPWALAQSRAKKQLYAALFERAHLAGAACLHALTRAEARNYRDFGCTQPIAVIPNGVEIPASLAPSLFLEAFPAARNRRVLLFLGRLHRKKGVDLLLRAWARVLAHADDAFLVLAGPAEDQTRAQAETLVAELGLTRQVLFPGMLEPAMKWSALAAAEGFVLPSYSEGLSMAALEAMGAGLPVILTENCNLPEAAEAGAGWQVRADEADLAHALAAWHSSSAAANRARGERGAALVRARYSWEAVTRQMAALYASVEGGCRPGTFPFVQLDQPDRPGQKPDRPGQKPDRPGQKPERAAAAGGCA